MCYEMVVRRVVQYVSTDCGCVLKLKSASMPQAREFWATMKDAKGTLALMPKYMTNEVRVHRMYTCVRMGGRAEHVYDRHRRCCG
jgi:hypothetical protein